MSTGYRQDSATVRDPGTAEVITGMCGLTAVVWQFSRGFTGCTSTGRGFGVPGFGGWVPRPAGCSG